MSQQIAYRIQPEVGIECWLIPLKNGNLRWRVFFDSQEVGMEFLNEN